MFFYEQLLLTFHSVRPKNLGLRAPLDGRKETDGRLTIASRGKKVSDISEVCYC